MPQINKLEQWISTLKSNDFFKNLTIQDFLDRRDSMEFDSLWLHDYNILIQYSFTDNETEISNQLRKNAYRQIYQLTTNAELAAYIRDDVELIAKSILRKQQNLWMIWHVWSCYLNDLDPTIQ